MNTVLQHQELIGLALEIAAMEVPEHLTTNPEWGSRPPPRRVVCDTPFDAAMLGLRAIEVAHTLEDQ